MPASVNRRAFLQALGTARGTAEFIRSLSPTGAWNDGPSFHPRGWGRFSFKLAAHHSIIPRLSGKCSKHNRVLHSVE